MNHDVVSRVGSTIGHNPNGRRAPTSPASLFAAVVLVAGCASSPTVDQTAVPAAAAASVAPPTAVSPATSQAASTATESPAPSAAGDTTVRPGEAWIASQRLVDLDNPDDGHGIFLVRPDGTGDHQLVPELDGSEMHPAWSPVGEQSRSSTRVRTASRSSGLRRPTAAMHGRWRGASDRATT